MTSIPLLARLKWATGITLGLSMILTLRTDASMWMENWQRNRQMWPRIWVLPEILALDNGTTMSGSMA